MQYKTAIMKNAMLPLYTLLVIGWLACLQTDDNLAPLMLNACYQSGTGTNNTSPQPSQQSNTILVTASNSAKNYNCTRVTAVNEVSRNLSLNTITALQKNHGSSTIICLNR